MVENFPGPYEVRFFYTVSGLQHELRLSLPLAQDPLPGTPFAAIVTEQKGGANGVLQADVDSLVALLRPFWPNTVTIDFAELWKYVPLTNQANFISGYTIGLTGTAAGTIVLSHQATFTWRSIEGGIMKMVLLETDLGGDAVVSYAASGARSIALFDYIAGAFSAFWARDTSYANAPLRRSNGQNEAVWRKRNRP